ncbi:hypothetical protein LRHMDP2_1230 [Lacticaseibacillus rhamnosus LRHMDP2]|uniref:Uncharacterized protein n=1 Tax=Lacticaseibacillus rhamnosus LRHMDP3 TaxID=1203259 RepID=A0AB33XVL8_LACRH|nr:hypothetical protein LRHMDP3_1172 [Lacticaseibacillus rhamnosus LRHMDP3]EKS52063.1 hypothetical protein LRHMDP2_1230 [Lacticaseibacillus rhamnosus LRHMDP2]
MCSLFVKYTDVTMTLSTAQLFDHVGLDLPNGQSIQKNPLSVIY